MKLWTYAEVLAKVNLDCDLQDQQFVQPMEMVGYANEGIKEAEAEILKIDEDYFLTNYPMPLVQGTSQYKYPRNIYAYKIRGIQYSVGTIIYPVRRVRRKDKFNKIAFDNVNNQADDYQYYTQNDSSAQGAYLTLQPPSRETAVLSYPYVNSPSAPMWMWYIRHANRIPIIGEQVDDYDHFLPSAVSTGAGTITTAGVYVTGDQIKLYSDLGVVPGGLTSGVIYFVIAGSGSIKLATSLANAQAGTSIALTSVGTGVLGVSIIATNTILQATVLDIPEFVEFIIQWMKCRVYEKEGDPRLDGGTVTLEHLRKQMVDTLTEKEQDDDNTVQPDLSSYYDMS